MRSLLLLLLLLPRDDAIRLLLVRHGRTFMNEHPSQPGKAAVGFVDPGLWDTRLTPTGEAQARELNAQLRVRQSAGEPGIDLLLASPLRRALATAEIGFDGVACASQRVEPLAAERCYLSSDVGSPLAELQAAFAPEWRLSSSDTLKEDWWFQGDGAAEWRAPGTYLHPGEDGPTFYARMARLIVTLRACEAEVGEHGVTALVVTHALTGRSFANCEWADMALSEVPDAPFMCPDL